MELSSSAPPFKSPHCFCPSCKIETFLNDRAWPNTYMGGPFWGNPAGELWQALTEYMSIARVSVVLGGAATLHKDCKSGS
eukprot:2813411-Amphidinium_carterae.1